jgi:hypothetical protein
VEPEGSRTGLAIYYAWPLMPSIAASPPLGNYLRRMKAKLGPQAATMATAHKIAVIFYTMIKNQVEYDETIWDARDARGRKSCKQNSNGKPNNWATSSFPLNPRPHN